MNPEKARCELCGRAFDLMNGTYLIEIGESYGCNHCINDE